MREGESKKLTERSPSTEKSDRPTRTSPFVRWRSLREPKSLRSPEPDGRTKNAKGAPAAEDDLSIERRREHEGEASNPKSADPKAVMGKSVPGQANALGVIQKGADRKDAAADEDKYSHPHAKPQPATSAHHGASRSLLLNKSSAAEESVVVGGATQLTAGTTGSDRNSVTKPLPGSATIAEAPGGQAEISRGAHGRRSLRILFGRPSSTKHKTSIQQQQPQQSEQHLQTSPTASTANASVIDCAPGNSLPAELNASSAVSTNGTSSSSSGEKPSKLASYKRSSAIKLSAQDSRGSANRESLPPAAAAADTSGGSQIAKLRSRGGTTAHRGSPKDGATRPASVNENQLHATQRPSLSLSPVCAVTVSDDWHSGVSLSSLSSSESSIVNPHEHQQQPAVAQVGSGRPTTDRPTASKQASAEPVGKLRLLPPAVTTKSTAVEKSAVNGHQEMQSPGTGDTSADEPAVVASATVADASSVLKFLSEHSKVLNSLAPTARAGCTEADIVLQLTEEVKLLKNGLIHCEAVLQEEEAARHKLEQELLERDSLIRTLQKQLSLCRCGSENGPSLHSGLTGGLSDSERPPKDHT